MAERTSSVVLLILLCLSAFLSGGLSASHVTHTAAVNNGAVKHAGENKKAAAGKEVDCFFGLPHLWPHPPLPSGDFKWPPHLPFTLPPLPSGDFKWPPHFTLPPLPAGGFKWPPHFPFTLPPLPAGGFHPPHWPFTLPPLPAGFKPPHWPFPLPPLPAGGFKPPHWPFPLPPMRAGGFHIPPHWPFVHPPFPGHFGLHGHAGAEGVDKDSVHA